MKAVLLLSALALVSASGFLELPLTSTIGAACASNPNDFTVGTFLVNPWPPVRNENIVMNMTGTFTAAATINALVISSYYHNITVNQLVLPRTGSYAKGAAYKDGYNTFFPSYVPSGSFSVTLQLRNTQNIYISCWEIVFTL